MSDKIYLACDICRCLGKGCNKKDECKRYLADNSCCIRYPFSDKLCSDDKFESLIPVVTQQ